MLTETLIPDSELVSGASVTIAGVTKRYGRQQVLAGADLNIAPGESVALLGANGSGKSTLLKSMVRLVDPDQGSIKIDDQEILGCSSRELRNLRSRMGVVFQKHNLVPRVSALTNVIQGCLGKSSSPRYWTQMLAPGAIRNRAMGCLEAVGLAHRATRQASRLSGGESQRVAIARALMQDPSILIADEPVASLDPKIGHEVMQLFLEMFSSKGKTFLFVSHDLDHALKYADRIVGLKEGKIFLDVRSGEVNRNDLAEIY